MDKLRNWGIAFVAIGLTLATIFSIFFYNFYNNPDKTIILPDNYYQLSVQSAGSIICVEPRSKSLLIGTAYIYAYPPTKNLTTILR